VALYRGPNNGIKYYICKFIRVGGDIFVTEPNDIDTQHLDLAEADGVRTKILGSMYSNPDNFDAGQLAFRNSSGRGRIRVGMYSMGFDLPLRDSLARVITGDVLEQNPLHQEYEIKLEIPPGRGKERG
jgi:hypothetical protein